MVTRERLSEWLDHGIPWDVCRITFVVKRQVALAELDLVEKTPGALPSGWHAHTARFDECSRRHSLEFFVLGDVTLEAGEHVRRTLRTMGAL